MRTRYVFAALCVLALAAGTVTTPAYADDHGDHGRGEHDGEGWGGGWNRGDHGGGWGHNRWSHDEWRGRPGYQPGYYAPPPVYYAPPPQPYFAPPGVNLFLPFR